MHYGGGAGFAKIVSCTGALIFTSVNFSRRHRHVRRVPNAERHLDAR